MASSYGRKHLKKLLSYTEKDCDLGISQRDKEVVKKYTEGKGFKDLSEEYGISYNRIRKIIHKFIMKVREKYNENSYTRNDTLEI